MNINLKRKLSDLTIFLIIFFLSFLILFFFAEQICNLFKLKIFSSTYSGVIYSVGFISFLIICSSLVLNICVNISIIAELKVKECGITDNKKLPIFKILLILGIILLILTGLLFAGDKISKERYNIVVKNKAITIINQYKKSIEKLPQIVKNKNEISEQDTELLNILSIQDNAYFNDVYIIKPISIDGQTAYKSYKNFHTKPTLYSPTENQSKYFNSVFNTKTTLEAKYIHDRENEYEYYYPIKDKNDDFRIILVFSRYSSYGKSM